MGDMQCQTIAKAQGLAGSWRSWTSDSSYSPSTRFSQPMIPYRLLDGTIVADGWAGLTSGALMNGIDMDEKGAALTGSEVWTGTLTNGTYEGSSCTDWTMPVNAETAIVGISGATDTTWTKVYYQYCNYGYQHLYCFQQ
jgi:hypothetical protein